MNKLLDAYDFIEHYLKRGKEVPEDVITEAREAEIDWLQRKLVAAFREHIDPILTQIKSDFTLVCDHKAKSATNLFFSREGDIASLLDDAILLSCDSENTLDEEEMPDEMCLKEPEEGEEWMNQPEEGELYPATSKSIGFTVKFKDGKVISKSNAKDTLIETLRYIGFEKASNFKDRTFKGYYLVDRRFRSSTDHKFQEKVENGWYVYVNMSNSTKKEMIRKVATTVGIKLSIFDNVDLSEVLFSDSSNGYNHKGRAMFSLNGGKPNNKRNSVLEAVKTFAKLNPDATYNVIHRAFPGHLQGSYGVIQTLSEIKNRRLRGQDIDNRFFLDPNDILTSADGVQYAVCKEWGNQFSNFQEHVKGFGWSLEEV